MPSAFTVGRSLGVVHLSKYAFGNDHSRIVQSSYGPEHICLHSISFMN